VLGSVRLKRWGSDKPCGWLRRWNRAARLEPSGKPEGSDEPNDCAPIWIRAALLEPRRKRRGSDQPIKRAVLGSVRLKRWGSGKPCGCLRGRIQAAAQEPRRKRRGSDKPIKGAVLDSLLLTPGRKRLKPSGKPEGSDEPCGCLLGRIQAALLEPRRKRRGSDQPIKRVVLGSVRLKPGRKRPGILGSAEIEWK
jgi:hypothetical protein